MQSQEKSLLVPNADQFRVFVSESLRLLDVRPATASRKACVTVNTLAMFLNRESHEIHLGTASKICDFLQSEASEQGKELPKYWTPVEVQ